MRHMMRHAALPRRSQAHWWRPAGAVAERGSLRHVGGAALLVLRRHAIAIAHVLLARPRDLLCAIEAALHPLPILGAPHVFVQDPLPKGAALPTPGWLQPCGDQCRPSVMEIKDDWHVVRAASCWGTAMHLVAIPVGDEQVGALLDPPVWAGCRHSKVAVSAIQISTKLRRASCAIALWRKTSSSLRSFSPSMFQAPAMSTCSHVWLHAGKSACKSVVSTREHVGRVDVVRNSCSGNWVSKRMGHGAPTAS